MATPAAPAWLASSSLDGGVALAWAPITTRTDFESGLPAGLVSSPVDSTVQVPDADAATGTTMSLQLKDISDSQSTYFDLPVTVGASGTMTVRVKYETEAGWDYARLYLDGVQQWVNSGSSGGFISVDIPVTAGTRTLRTYYSKDGIGSFGFDNIRVGSITYPASVADYEYRIDGGTPVSMGSGTITSFVVSGLTNGQTYSIQVRAVNAEGPGAWSPATSATPLDLGDTLIQDSFNRADSPSSPGLPELGGPYTVRAGTWGISANQLYTSVSAVSQITFPASQDVRVDGDFVNSGSTGGNGLGLMIRWIDLNNHWLFGRRTTGFVTLMRCIGGTYYQYSPDLALVEGQRLGLAGFGNKVYAFIGNKLMAQADDPWAATSAPVAGVRIASATTARLDNLNADLIRVRPGGIADGSLAEIIDDFEGSDLQIPTFVYKGRDKSSADEGSVA